MTVELTAELRKLKDNYLALLSPEEEGTESPRRGSRVIMGYVRPEFEKIPEEFLGAYIRLIFASTSPTHKDLDLALKKFRHLGKKGGRLLFSCILKLEKWQKKIELGMALKDSEGKRLALLTSAFQIMAYLMLSREPLWKLIATTVQQYGWEERLQLLCKADNKHYQLIVDICAHASSRFLFCRNYFLNKPSLFISKLPEVYPKELRGEDKSLSWKEGRFSTSPSQRTSELCNISSLLFLQTPMAAQKKSDDELVKISWIKVKGDLNGFFDRIEALSQNMEEYAAELASLFCPSANNEEDKQEEEAANTIFSRAMNFMGSFLWNTLPNNEVKDEKSAAAVVLPEKLIFEHLMQKDIFEKIRTMALAAASDCRQWRLPETPSVKSLELAITSLYMFFYKSPPSCLHMRLVAHLAATKIGANNRWRIFSGCNPHLKQRLPLNSKGVWQLYVAKWLAQLELPLEKEFFEAVSALNLNPILYERLRALKQHFALMAEMVDLLCPKV